MLDLDEELGALDVDDERDRVVDGHASRPVAFGDEGGEPAASAVPHGEVDDQIEVVFLQVVHDAALLLFSGTLTLVLLKRPIHRCHLKQEKSDKRGQKRRQICDHFSLSYCGRHIITQFIAHVINLYTATPEILFFFHYYTSVNPINLDYLTSQYAFPLLSDDCWCDEVNQNVTHIFSHLDSMFCVEICSAQTGVQVVTQRLQGLHGGQQLTLVL